MAATYTSKERCNDERPVADLGTLPTEQGHRMPDGTVHPIQIGLRMVEEFRMRVKENIKADPLRAVAKVYEEELGKLQFVVFALLPFCPFALIFLPLPLSWFI